MEPTQNPANDTDPLDTQSELGSLVVKLLKGVMYRDNDVMQWSALLQLQSRIRDYVAVMGLELILDEAEGYAFLKTRQLEENAESEVSVAKQAEIPRLVVRRPLSFPVSLLLALLRKKLVEFDATGGETRLVLSREQIVELIRLFLPDTSNEAKLVDQVERHINKVVELGFLRKLKSESATDQPAFEVRRIIKAFIDAQWLSEFDAKLDHYRQQLASSDPEKVGG